MEKKKIFGIELLKFLAAIMITNSHFKPLYPDGLSALGTFGAPGNALFFVVSGFTLMLSFGERNQSFSSWYKRRISRIWPSLLAWSCLLYPFIYGEPISLSSLWLGGNYWFIHCIVVYYIIYWLINKFASGSLKTIAVFSIILEIVIFFMMPMHKMSIYQTDYHYICFFSVMIMGGWMSQNKEKVESRNWMVELAVCIVSFVLFYAIQAVGKGHDGWRYYFQITSLIPLHSFLYYLYVLISRPWADRVVKMPVIGVSIRMIAALTLEIYLVGFVYVLTNFNNLFPLNLLIVFGIIVTMAYVVKVISNFIFQTLQEKPYDWRKMIFII